ncbi:MAG TPA: hypothetical protein DD379_15750 [Cyanobacteria bacterium UBA11162]|nr:hypothetical protein [Cyanobacteria bacterium UBA11162]
MLPVFYQTHLEKYLSQAQMITLKLLIWLLQNQKQVKIERLAATLPLPIQLPQPSSSYTTFFKPG